MTFEQLFEHFRDLYGVNNAVYTTSLANRVSLLSIATRRLQEGIRKRHSRDILTRLVAGVVARAFAVADHFRSIPLNKVMCQKYPPGSCGYCENSPCECRASERSIHSAEKGGEVVPQSCDQLGWTLGQHARNLYQLFNDRNCQYGVDYCLLRLFSEAAEITEFEQGVAAAGMNAHQIQLEYAKEIADVLAWVIAIAGILEIDIEVAVMSVYGRGCPVCSQKPCMCTKSIVVGGVIRHTMDVYPQSQPT